MKQIINSCVLQLITKSNLVKHIKIALFVGIVLNFINQFNVITGFQFEEINLIKAMITFLVPFSVSVYSSATIGKAK